MARSYARLMTSIWSDDEFRALPALAQRLYLVLISQPDLSSCGVLTVHEGRLAALAPDTKPKDVARDRLVLEAGDYVVVDDSTGELWVRSFMRHDGVTTSPNLLKSAARSWGAIHSKAIRERVREEIPEPFREGFPQGLLELSPKGIGQALRDGFLDPFTEGMGEGSLDHSLSPELSNPSPATLRPPGSARPRSSERVPLHLKVLDDEVALL